MYSALSDWAQAVELTPVWQTDADTQGNQPYHYCENVAVLSDRDVISYAFCLDGFTILSVTHGDCLTKQLTHRLHASHNLRATYVVFCFRCYNCMSVIMGHMTTRVLAHCTSSLQLTSCFVSVHLLFIRQLFVLDFSQTFTVSGLHSKSANGLSLSRWSGENRIHMEVVIENVQLIPNCWWGVTSKQEKTLK